MDILYLDMHDGGRQVRFLHVEILITLIFIHCEKTVILTSRSTWTRNMLAQSQMLHLNSFKPLQPSNQGWVLIIWLCLRCDNKLIAWYVLENMLSAFRQLFRKIPWSRNPGKKENPFRLSGKRQCKNGRWAMKNLRGVGVHLHHNGSISNQTGNQHNAGDVWAEPQQFALHRPGDRSGEGGGLLPDRWCHTSLITGWMWHPSDCSIVVLQEVRGPVKWH